MKIRKKYLELAMAPIVVDPETSLLTGSKTSVKININSVTVDNYAPGFNDGAGNDFKEISFD